MHLALQEEPVDLVLELADQQHPPVAVEQRALGASASRVTHQQVPPAPSSRSPSDTCAFSESSSSPDARLQLQQRREVDVLVAAADQRLHDLLGAAATGIGTSSSRAASAPSRKSFSSSAGVNVGLKSRFTYAGVL